MSQLYTASFQCLLEKEDKRVGVLRIHPGEGHWEDRSPYVWACTVYIEDKLAEILGVVGLPPPSQRNAMRVLFDSMGVEVSYEVKGKIRKHIPIKWG